MSSKQVYMDNNATTPIHPQVKETIIEAMDLFGNPSSVHELGRRARASIEQARADIAAFIGAESDEIIFVGNGSEANNTVLNLMACPSAHCVSCRGGRINIVTTKIEHPCILEGSKCLKDKGVDVQYLDVDKYGKVDLGQLKDSIGDNTSLVSIMTANNEIGTIQDIGRIADIVKEKGAFFHTDAVQAVGKIPVNVKLMNVDFLSFSAHKIYGPKGVGALYVRKGVPFCPFIRGGHQEKGRRAGTENTLGIIGMAKAIELRRFEMVQENERLLGFKKILRERISSSIPDVQFNGHPEDCLAGTLNVSFSGAEGESILLYLDLEGIYVSTGSACASGSLDPSHVLLATGLGAEHAHGSVRISMGRETTIEDVEYMLEKLPPIIKKIRSMSTSYSKNTDKARRE